ncbi:hypothetical protein N7451_002529 [Penicillium sp. IBT 35674x]|nr:hypothetical protein N7451_002529 [Penicillium sp. IBT 35674x]
MALRTSAEDAEDAAAGFHTFRAPLPEHAAEVTGLISDLYAISSSLTSLDALSQNVQYRRHWPRVQPDVELVRSSLKYTIEDIFDYMHRLDNGRTSPDNYKRVWVSMSRFFWGMSRSMRFQLAWQDIGFSLESWGRCRNLDSSLLVSTRNGLRDLLALQEHRLLPQGLGSLGLGQIPSDPPPTHRPISRPPSRNDIPRPPSRVNIPRPPSRGEPLSPISPVSDRDHRRRRSFERPRPANQAHLSPQSPLSPSSGTGTFSDSIPPSVPEAPYSPLTGSVSATTNTSHSTQNDAIQYHWIREIFSSYDTETAIPNGPEEAGCFDDSHPGIKQILKEKGFERILQLAFNDESEMTVYFYLRERDHRARIVCKVPHRTRSSEYFCLPLNMLEVVRAGSCLQLCRRRNAGKELVLWARLKFATIESMVVFFCAFLALRSQDAGRPVDDIRDYELEHEEELFGGQIVDDDYPHALRVYQDNISGAVRLQASVHKGIMDRTPVWTAFVTHQLKRRGWLKPLDSRTVAVRDLKLTILMSAEDYNPPTTTRGEHVLKFASRRDADGFLETMKDIAMTIG